MLSLIPLDWLIGAVAGALALFGVFFAGKRSGKGEANVDALKGYKTTRQRMDYVDQEIVGDDPAVLRVRMRERGQR